MKKNLSTGLLEISFVLFSATLFSCSNNSSDKTESAPPPADTLVASTPTNPSATTEPKPFNVLLLTHAVKDYAKWRPIFDADSVSRKAAGMETIVVGREIDKPNNLMTAFTISDMQKVKEFANSSALKEKMKEGGVIGKPSEELLRVIRYNPDSHEKQWVDISHKVKNFDAWLKVFDQEGTAKRAGEGLVDVVMARGLEDSNLVHLVFDITDMSKAKAALFSPEKKKLMMSAGVEGKPKIAFYKLAE